MTGRSGEGVQRGCGTAVSRWKGWTGMRRQSMVRWWCGHCLGKRGGSQWPCCKAVSDSGPAFEKSSRRGVLGAPQAPYSWSPSAGCRRASFACVPASSALRKTGGLAEDSPGFDIQNCCSRSSAPAVARARRPTRRRIRGTDAAAAHVRRPTRRRSRDTAPADAHACRSTRRRSRGAEPASARAGTSSQAGAQAP